MSDTTATKLPRSWTIFALPRELRNLIYHHLWCSNPILLNSNSRFVDSTVQLRFRGSCQLDDRNEYPRDEDDTKFPSGLFASKQLLSEALEEFTRRAEWLWYEDMPGLEQTWVSTQADGSKIQDITVLFDMLPQICINCPQKRHLSYGLLFGDSQTEVGTALEKDRAEGHGIRCLRISGFTKATNLEDEGEHASLLAQHFRSVGKISGAQRLELSLWQGDAEKPRLYEVLGEDPDVSVSLVST